MRLLLPMLLVLLAACGSSPDGENTELQTDTATTAEVNSAAVDNTLTETEKSEGWTLLFDGKTTNGWHLFKNIPGRWAVNDGLLNPDSSRGPALMGNSGIMASSMVTDKEFENFHLKVDWKISTGGNSGIMILVNEAPSIVEDYQGAPEMQILDNEGYRGFGYPTTPVMRAGALYGLLPCADSNAVKPANEWNTSELIKKDSSLEFKLNGLTTVKTTMWDKNWDKLVASSSYKNPPYGMLRKGKISLQDHSYRVWFKNIKIKEL